MAAVQICSTSTLMSQSHSAGPIFAPCLYMEGCWSRVGQRDPLHARPSLSMYPACRSAQHPSNRMASGRENAERQIVCPPLCSEPIAGWGRRATFIPVVL
ncbi:hypothetical protein JZ751_005658 [Albula glossodonta]|uniref:Uncharacterized protein n=1 Tax=Albula glossodonta TaxID=121402 RepID=A0A8T2MV88_9TELE|nr:hypothetical protein JZ751_009324 [Albula glossodonta]KAG9329332.1 hypothetical protein JZ751_005658 [Albula glossodonta]